MLYQITWETDEGLAFEYDLECTGRSQVVAYMKKTYPEDIGADGFITDEDGNEYPLNW